MRQRMNNKVKLICTRCGKEFMRQANIIRENQKDFYCGKICLQKPKEEKLKSRRESRKAWNDRNRDHVRARAREYRKKNPDQIIASRRKDWINNKANYQERAKRYYERNIEHIRLKRRQDYLEDRENRINYMKQYRKAHPEWAAETRKKHRENNRPSLMWSSTKKAARAAGVNFDITKEWIKSRLDAGLCEMSGLPFDMQGKRTPNSPSIDRIKPGGHYTQENCRIILWSINRALNNYGEEYILDVFAAIIKKRGPG